MDKLFAGYFSVITDFILVFFEPSSPHNSQRLDGNQQHNEDNTYYHMITHAHTTKHNQTQPNTNTSQTPQNTTPTSSTDAGPLHSKWHEACTGNTKTVVSCMLRTCSANREWTEHSGKSELCVQREPTERVIIVIVAEKEEREDKREESREREREKERRKNDGREKEEGEKERRDEREIRELLPPPSVLLVCRFKTSPCFGSKRFRVCKTHACSTHARVSQFKDGCECPELDGRYDRGVLVKEGFQGRKTMKLWRQESKHKRETKERKFRMNLRIRSTK